MKVSILCDLSPWRAAPTVTDSTQQLSLGAADRQIHLPHDFLQVVIYEKFGPVVNVGDYWGVWSRHGCWRAVGADELVTACRV